MIKSLFVMLLSLPFIVKAQTYNVIDWGSESEIIHGLKIKTQMPVDSSLHYSTISIEGYDNGRSSSIGLKIAWTLKDGKFFNQTASSFGGSAPDIMLCQKDGLIEIFLSTWGANTKLHISAFSKGETEAPQWFTNWSILDEPIDGINLAKIIYHNEFNGDVKIESLNSEVAALSTADIGELSLDHVKGNLLVKGHTPGIADTEGNIYLYGQKGAIDILSGDDINSHIDFRGVNNVNGMSQGRILHSDGEGFKFYTAGVNSTPKLIINNNGVIGVGNTTGLAENTGVYKLYVEGGIRTRKIKVDQVKPWPDYVFDNNYQLRSLYDLEDYIKRYNHLPEIPDVEEVESNGTDIGDMQALLLKKIEELTLYIIEQDKKQNILNKQVEKLSKYIEGKEMYSENKKCNRK